MLVEFSVENYRSIKEKQTLSFVAANGDEHPDNVFVAGRENIRLLKTLLLYGPNASGKSNVLKALNDFIDFISISNKYNIKERIPFFAPFYYDEKTLTKPVSFSIEFIANDGVRYSYSIQFSIQEVIEEKLSYYPTGHENKLFYRVSGKDIDFGSSLKGDKKSIEKQLLPHHLFLSKAANSNHKQLQELYLNLCESHLFVFQIFEGIGNLSDTQNRIINNSLDINKLTALCRIADPSILTTEIKKISVDENDEKVSFFKTFIKSIDNEIFNDISESLITNLSHRTFFLHENNRNKITPLVSITDESQGLQKIFGLAPIIIDTITNGYTLVIDELNNSLHPLIALEIIKLFNNTKTNLQNAQLLASTHDVTLLDPDLLRRDQIWFTEKNDDNATELFSLADFPSKEVRKDTPFDKWYLSGKFGAIPVVKDIQL